MRVDPRRDEGRRGRNFVQCPYCGFNNCLEHPDGHFEDFPWWCLGCLKNFRVDSEVQLILHASTEESYRDREKAILHAMKRRPNIHIGVPEDEQERIVEWSEERCQENEQLDGAPDEEETEEEEE